MSDGLLWQKIRNVFTRDVLHTALNQLWRLFTGPLTLIFIPLFLTPEHQGYWYTFISLSTLLIFADLGFTNILLQFTAHEAAFLTFDERCRVSGPQEHMQKLASFLVFALKWAMWSLVIVSPVIFAIGCWVFLQKDLPVHWLLPWCVFVVGSAWSFFNSCILAFLQGCGQVSMAQKIMFVSSALSTVGNLLLLYLGCNLWALGGSMLATSMWISRCIYRTMRDMIRQLLQTSKTCTHSWQQDFLRLLWRYAISWSSGYFIFQLYVPLTFHYHDAVSAGRVGITMALWTAIFNVANVWVLATTPKVNMLVARREWHLLDRMLCRQILLGVATFLFCCLGLVVVVLAVGHWALAQKIMNRFLGIVPMVCLALSWLFQVVIYAIAVYLRAHKQEPFLLMSVLFAIGIGISTFLCLKYGSVEYVFAGFLSSCILFSPLIAWIFFSKRKAWHQAA